MPTRHSQAAFDFTFDLFTSKPIVVERSAAQVSSDGGLLPFRQLDEQIGLTREFAQALIDRRNVGYIDHTFLEMARLATPTATRPPPRARPARRGPAVHLADATDQGRRLCLRKHASGRRSAFIQLALLEPLSTSEPTGSCPWFRLSGYRLRRGTIRSPRLGRHHTSWGKGGTVRRLQLLLPNVPENRLPHFPGWPAARVYE